MVIDSIQNDGWIKGWLNPGLATAGHSFRPTTFVPPPQQRSTYVSLSQQHHKNEKKKGSLALFLLFFLK
jgi:hypothetical protein